MRAPEIDYFLAHCKQLYFAPDEAVIGPADGPVKTLYFIRKGAVTGSRGLADQMAHLNTMLATCFL